MATRNWQGTKVYDQDGNEIQRIFSSEIVMTPNDIQTVKIEIPVLEMELKDGECKLVVDLGRLP